MFKRILNHKVVKAGSWYLATNFFTKGLAFLTIPIFTRLMSTSDYGITSTYNSYMKIFVIVFSLDLYASVQRGLYDFKEEFEKYISSILFLGSLTFLIFSLIIVFFLRQFEVLFDLEKFLIIALLIHSYFSFIQQFVLARYRVVYKYKIVSLVAILNSLLSIGLSILLIKFVFSDIAYYGKILGGLIPISVSGLILLIYTFLKGKKFIDIKFWKYALIISLPLIAHNLSGIINAQFDRILLNKYIGASETGIYSFAYNIGMIISVIWTSMNQAWVPWFFEKMNDKDYSNIRKRADNFRDIFTLLYSVILFVSPEIIKLMADKAYWDGLYIIPFIFMAYYFQLMYSFEVSVEFFSKKTHLIAAGTISAAAVNVILNMFFIPLYGKTAAAITTVISYFFLFVFHYLITNFILKIKIFSFVFHLKSILYVFGTTILFIIFQRYFLIRIVLILFFSVLLFTKYRRIKLKNGK